MHKTGTGSPSSFLQRAVCVLELNYWRSNISAEVSSYVPPEDLVEVSNIHISDYMQGRSTTARHFTPPFQNAALLGAERRLSVASSLYGTVFVPVLAAAAARGGAGRACALCCFGAA